MSIPDVVGLQLGEAMKIIGKAGMSVGRIKATSPPKHKSVTYDDTYRVVRVQVSGSREIELLVCDPHSD